MTPLPNDVKVHYYRIKVSGSTGDVRFYANNMQQVGRPIQVPSESVKSLERMYKLTGLFPLPSLN